MEIPNEQQTEIQGVKVIYCGICGLPPEYCEYGPSYDKCKTWILENCRSTLPKLVEEIEKKAADDWKTSTTTSSNQKSEGETQQKEEVKPAAKAKKTKEKEAPKVYITTNIRSKKKSVTIVTGLDKFGIKLDTAAKQFRTKLACGASVVKGATPDLEQIDIQGEFVDEVVQLLKESFQITEDSIVLEEPTKKKK
jgi:density-regulated protein DRP1